MASEQDDKLRRAQQEFSVKEEELKAKISSLEDALSREQQKGKEKDAKETQRRNELNHQISELTEERSALRTKLQATTEKEEELNLANQHLNDRKKEIAKLKSTHNEEKANLQEQLEEKRRQVDRQQQEVSDLRCQISILEHKLQHATSKQSQHESQMEEMSKLQLQIQTLTERMTANDRAQTSEIARHQRDRRALEEKVTKLTQDLNAEREPPTKTQLVEKYETKLAKKTTLLQRALQAGGRPGGPLPPLSAEEDDVVESYLERLQAYIHQSDHRSQSPAAKRRATEQKDHAKLLDLLERLPQEVRRKLLKRFEDSVEANIVASRRFSDTSGFPSVHEDPAVLVNHIANVTAQRDELQTQVDQLIQEKQAEKQSRKSGGDASHDSPGSASKAQPQVVYISPSPAPHGNKASPNKAR